MTSPGLSVLDVLRSPEGCAAMDAVHLVLAEIDAAGVNATEDEWIAFGAAAAQLQAIIDGRNATCGRLGLTGLA